MQNLKINIFLKNPVILNRYLTIDNILLYLHFNKLRQEKKIQGFIDIKKYIENNKTNLFLDLKNGVLSGSIWYIEKDTPIVLNNYILTKQIEAKKIYKLTGKKIDTSRGEFKAFRFGYETISVPHLYFYVRGKKDYIEKLLNDLKFIGKKTSIGLGEIKKIKIEIIKNDKSFMLNETTPSKPLPCKYWKVKSKKVAFYRALPPYYEKKDIEPCYMPTRALIEMKDKSFENPNFIALTDVAYISASRFARENSNFDEVELFGKLNKKIKYTNNNQEYHCIICGEKEKEGLIGNPKNILPKTFNDYAFLSQGEFICANCLWSMKQEKLLGNTLIDKNKITYLQGGKMSIKGAKEQQKFRDEFFRNLDLLKPPFLISLKSTANAQHTVFKNKVAISNALIPISFGIEEEILIDVELLKEAIQDMENIIKNNPCIKKPHLLNLEKIDSPSPKLTKKCLTEENIKILQDFWRKYDRSIRKILNRIMI